MKGNFFLKKESDFKRVYNKRRTSGNRNFTLYQLKNNLNINRMGISINKKVGKAVVRNKIKRQLKALYRENYSLIKDNNDFIIVVKQNVADLSYVKLKSAFLHILKVSKLLKEE